MPVILNAENKIWGKESVKPVSTPVRRYRDRPVLSAHHHAAIISGPEFFIKTNIQFYSRGILIWTYG
jgi:hypothetical protein